MKTEITNLLTQEKTLFVNDLSLTENIVNHIICSKKQTGLLLDQDHIEKIKNLYHIKESVSTITGKYFAYCESFDLHAKYIN